MLQRLVDGGNTVLVIEHNLDVIKQADWLVDLGPEGGEAGGEIVAVGTPEEVAAVPESYTGQFLRPLLERRRARVARVNWQQAGAACCCVLIAALCRGVFVGRHGRRVGTTATTRSAPTASRRSRSAAVMLGQVEYRCHDGQVVTREPACRRGVAPSADARLVAAARCSCSSGRAPVFVALRDDDPSPPPTAPSPCC